MSLYNMTNITNSSGPVEWMVAVDHDLTNGILSISLSILLWFLIIILAKGEDKDYKKALFAGSFLTLAINSIFIYVMQLVTYKILFFYLAMTIIGYVSLQRDPS